MVVLTVRRRNNVIEHILFSAFIFFFLSFDSFYCIHFVSHAFWNRMKWRMSSSHFMRSTVQHKKLRFISLRSHCRAWLFVIQKTGFVFATRMFCGRRRTFHMRNSLFVFLWSKHTSSKQYINRGYFGIFNKPKKSATEARIKNRNIKYWLICSVECSNKLKRLTCDHGLSAIPHLRGFNAKIFKQIWPIDFIIDL